MTIHSRYLEDEAATLAFGQNLARAIAPGDSGLPEPEASTDAGKRGAIIYLQGDLGAGKTTLTRGVLRGFGFQGPVKSPTYTLVEPYEFDQRHIYHFDFYRLGSPEEVEYLGVEEYFRPPNLCIVEWADRGGKLIPDPDLILSLASEADGRLVSWNRATATGEEIAERMLKTGRNK